MASSNTSTLALLAAAGVGLLSGVAITTSFAHAHKCPALILSEQASDNKTKSSQKTKSTKEDSAEGQIEALVRENILSLKPYRCARDDYSEGILLDANENSLGPPVEPNELEYERYPSPYQWELKQLIADYRGVKKEQIFVGVGSDEAIDLLIRIFCIPSEDEILITPPTYGMYSVSADVNDVKVVSVPLTPEFQVKVKETLDAVTEKTKIIFLCSPGNPTARMLKRSDVEEILKSSYKGIVVVDEAYIDFAEEPSFCTLVEKYPRLVVLQTLSKAFGLAGIRLGMAFGNPHLIQIMNNVKAPYNVNVMTSKVAQDALKNIKKVKENIAQIKKEKIRVMKALKDIPTVGKIHPSDANFILFQVKNSYLLYKNMAEQGLVVRYRGNLIHCEDCLRVTVGTPEENDEFLRQLKEQVKKHNQ